MLCRVKMTSRCIRPKTAVETEIISAELFLKVRTRCCFFTTVRQQLTPFCIICGFPRRIQPRYARPGETSTLYYISCKKWQRGALFKQIIEKIAVEVVPISWSLFQFEWDRSQCSPVLYNEINICDIRPAKLRQKWAVDNYWIRMNIVSPTWQAYPGSGKAGKPHRLKLAIQNSIILLNNLPMMIDK